MKAIFENNRGQSIEFKITAPYRFQKVEEDTGVIIYDNKGMQQDGASYLGNTLDNKHLTLKFAVEAYTLEEMNSLKTRVYNVFNPKLGPGWLFYRGKKIQCIVEDIPYYKENISGLYHEYIIDLVAHSPYWLNEDDNLVEVALWKGAFHFPLIIPEDEGIIFGAKQPDLIARIFNEGHVETGLIIEFRANGEVEKPSVFDINKQKGLQVNTKMDAGDIITVNTNYGFKTIRLTKNNQNSNILHLLDIAGGNDYFLQLDPGQNLIRYDAEKGIDNLSVVIKYNDKYLGV